MGGIYAIRNLANGKCYVGSAVSIHRRWTQHRSDLRRERHKSPKLQAAWAKHGPGAFHFEVLEEVADPALLLSREQHWIDHLGTISGGYNILPVAGSRLGAKHSPATLAKLRAKRAARVNHPCSEETKRKLSEAQKGRPRKPVSDEYRANMSALMKGRKKPPRTPEQRARAAENQRGKQASPETRAKMSEAQRLRFQRERANGL